MKTLTESIEKQAIQANNKIRNKICFLHASSHFGQLVLPSLTPTMAASGAFNLAQCGLAIASFFAVSAIGQIITGHLADKSNAKRILITALALYCVGMIICGLSHSVYFLILGAVVSGLGNSVFHPVDYKLLNKFIANDCLQKAFSLHSLAGTAGGAIAPFVLVSISSTSSAASAFIVAGFLFALLAVYLAARTLGFDDDSMPSTMADSHETERGATSIWAKIIWSMIYFFAFSFAMAAMQIYAPTYFNQSRGLTLTEAGYSLTAFLIAFAMGTALGGFVKVLQIGKEGLALTCFMAVWASLNIAAMLTENIALSILFFVVGGLFGGVCSPMRDMLIRNSVKGSNVGRAFGYVYSGWDIGYSMAPIAIAIVYQRFGSESAIALGIFAIAICGFVAQIITIGTQKIEQK